MNTIFVENIIRVFNQITLAQNTPQYTPHRTMTWNSTKSGAPSVDQVMMHRNTARSNFNAMLNDLPKLRRNPRAPQVDGLLSDTFNENASFGGHSTQARTMQSRYNSAQKSKSSLGGAFKMPSYFFTPDDSGNLFNSMK